LKKSLGQSPRSAGAAAWRRSTPKDEITIYVAGYVALRTQTPQRNTVFIQLFAIAATVLLALGLLVLRRSIEIGAGLAVVLALFALVIFRLKKDGVLGRQLWIAEDFGCCASG
jgi:uncharacterized membrane protein